MIPTLDISGDAALPDQEDDHFGMEVEHLREADCPMVSSIGLVVTAHYGTTMERGRWSSLYFLATMLQGGCPGLNATSSSTEFVRMSEQS